MLKRVVRADCMKIHIFNWNLKTEGTSLITCVTLKASILLFCLLTELILMRVLPPNKTYVKQKVKFLVIRFLEATNEQ